MSSIGRVVAFNGSPRAASGNTQLMLNALLEGIAEITHETPEIHQLAATEPDEALLGVFAGAETAILGFPLYTDAMPGVTKRFIDALRPLTERPSNPRLLFLVQSGFPEAIHSRAVEAYLQRLAARLRSEYLGTIVKGGGEATRYRPPERNAELFARLRELGRGVAGRGALDPGVLRLLASPERFPLWLSPIVRLFARSRVANFFWDKQLRENGAFDERFDRPYA